MPERPETGGDEVESAGELRVIPREGEDYKIFPSSSVRGGVQLRGDFLIEFMADTYDEPDASIYSIGDEETEFVRHENYRNAVIQRKQAGVLMSQSNAFSMATWVIAELFGENVTDTDVEEVLFEAFREHLVEEDQ